MSKSVGKYASLLANFLLIVFPLFFAMNVYICIDKEADVFHRYGKELTIPETEELVKNSENFNLTPVVNPVEEAIQAENCSNAVLVNVSFAVFLAALWNMKKVIKIGAI